MDLAAKASKEQSSLSLLDAAGSSSRGAAQHEGSLTLYYPTNPDDARTRLRQDVEHVQEDPR